MLLYSLLTGISGGLYLPFMRNRLRAHLINSAWFGDRRFRYFGQDEALLKRFLLMGLLALGLLVGWVFVMVGALPLLNVALHRLEVPLSEGVFAAVGLLALVGLLPALGLAWLWYVAGEWRYVVAHTALGELRFRLELPTWRFMWLTVSNLLGLLFSVGLAFPWVVVRTARFITERVQVLGDLDPASIRQHPELGPDSGEGLAEAFDLGSI